MLLAASDWQSHFTIIRASPDFEQDVFLFRQASMVAFLWEIYTNTQISFIYVSTLVYEQTYSNLELMHFRNDEKDVFALRAYELLSGETENPWRNTTNDKHDAQRNLRVRKITPFIYNKTPAWITLHWLG